LRARNHPIGWQARPPRAPFERLQEEPRLNEQDEIEYLLVSINTMLNSLDGTLIEAMAKRQ